MSTASASRARPVVAAGSGVSTLLEKWPTSPPGSKPRSTRASRTLSVNHACAAGLDCGEQTSISTFSPGSDQNCTNSFRSGSGSNSRM